MSTPAQSPYGSVDEELAARERPAWRETPFGRMVRFLGERPKPPLPKRERWAIAFGITEAWDEDAKDGASWLQVFSRSTARFDRVYVRHCSAGMRPCWCWPDEEQFKIDRTTMPTT